jgi:RNA recognition motif-containing protein
MKNIFVSNLSFRLKNEDLQEAFEAFGDVSSAKIINDKVSGRSRGFGFVEMPDDEAADEAINALNGAELDGKTISVSEARPRDERPKDSRPKDFHSKDSRSRDGQRRGGNDRFGNRDGGYNRGGSGYNRGSRY